MKVVSTHKLVEGVEMTLSNFQIAASGPDGVITMVNAEIVEEQERTDLVGYSVRPGCWRVTPEEGMQPLSLPDEAYYETDTSRDMLRHLNAFVGKISVYEKYNLPPRRGILFGRRPGNRQIQPDSALLSFPAPTAEDVYLAIGQPKHSVRDTDSHVHEYGY
jgi:hypothetical protein